ncbi:paraquat-inducible protein A [Burkholderia sp. WP9]|uniref:paraquat-inducible protein A n=1 Tax=Burkholderia sp. WP9 TaxID=1500263 RepID=UPI0008992A27|nr:paraquat-inducible protein A [Burkholderia sp. WP9]SEF12768.1 paraquat-inducible protein A [Burkholderia sp. WP9]
MQIDELIGCPECDMLFHKRALPYRTAAKCTRCGAMLYPSLSANLDKVCAITLAALITFLIAQAFPIVELETNGILTETTLIGAIVVLWNENMEAIAFMVFCAAILFPFVELVAMLYLFVPLRAGFVPVGFDRVLRAILFVRPWGMIEVFMLGVLVTLVKMGSIARVIPGPALFAFGALTLLIALILALDPRALWDVAERLANRGATSYSPSNRLPSGSPPALQTSLPFDSLLDTLPPFLRMHGGPPWRDRRIAEVMKDAPDPIPHGVDDVEQPQPEPVYTTVTRAGRIACHTCRRLQSRALGVERTRCTRCGTTVHRRHPDSIARTWALLVAAAILYIPANVYPVMHTSSIGGSEDDTIMSGVALFWDSGDYPLAGIIFIASVLVPMLKLGTLALLTWSVQSRSTWRPRQRTTLFRIVERVGRWSMLDVFVITLTVALVRFESIAVITAGPGAIAFGSVVVLTMLASLQFDPRLIWDNIEPSGTKHD